MTEIKDDDGDYSLSPDELRYKDFTSFLRQRYAVVTRRPLSVEDHSVLQLATKLTHDTYGDSHIGDKVWLTLVSGTSCYADTIKDWAFGLADAMGGIRYERGNALVKRYSPLWGHKAALDGINLALFGNVQESVRTRCTATGADRKAYTRVRNFIGGALVMQGQQFEQEVGYSFEVHRL